MAFNNAAYSELQKLLSRYGLDSLVDWAYQQVLDGRTAEEIERDLYDQPAFRQRFRAIFGREEAGKPAISVDEVLAYEKQMAGLMHFYGIPEGFYDDPDDFAKMLINDMSINEQNTRLAAYAQAAEQNRPYLRQELDRLYGVGSGEVVDDLSIGELAAYFLDPERGVNVLQTQLQSARVAAAARRRSFTLSAEQAERFTAEGVDDVQALQRFTEVAQQSELFQPLVGEAEAEGQDTQTAIGVALQDTDALRRVERLRQRRTGRFGGSSAFASGSEGFSLGES